MAQGMIPQGRNDFNGFQENFIVTVEPMLDSFGITAESFKPLADEQQVWQQLWQKTVNPQNRTQADVQARDGEQKVYTELLRSFINQFIKNNPKVSNADKGRLGLTVSDGSRTASPVPTTAPAVTVSIGSQQHTIAFMDEGSTSKAKPAGVHGCEIWMKRGAAPTTDSELSFVITDTASPHIMKFDSSEVGTMVYYRLRWVNTRGEAGPWSKLASAVVG
jgi:hypothetical protein